MCLIRVGIKDRGTKEVDFYQDGDGEINSGNKDGTGEFEPIGEIFVTTNINDGAQDRLSESDRTSMTDAEFAEIGAIERQVSADFTLISDSHSLSNVTADLGIEPSSYYAVGEPVYRV